MAISRLVSGSSTFFGVEGGEHPAFAEPAHYDPRALRGGRVVLAAFDLGTELPVGRTRVATLHFALDAGAQPTFVVELVTAAGPDGDALEARATIER